jgi:hypothetical protein
MFEVLIAEVGFDSLLLLLAAVIIAVCCEVFQGGEFNRNRRNKKRVFWLRLVGLLKF